MTFWLQILTPVHSSAFSAHKMVLDSLGVRQVQAVIGGSLGGMQVGFIPADRLTSVIRQPHSTALTHSR
jgi:23S rRNA pseudoU1915 N3-methylase RlmH